MATFSHVICYVDHVEKTLAFFEKAFGLKRKFLHEEGFYGTLETGPTELAFADASLGPGGHCQNSPKQKQPIEIALTVDDVETAYKKALQAGALDHAAPEKKFWGQTVAYVRAPAGILIEIAGKME